MVKEAKSAKREHPCPHCLTKFQSPALTAGFVALPPGVDQC